MPILELSALLPYDCVYFAAQARDVASSCPARIAAERARGLRVLIVGLFDSAEQATALDALVSGLRVDGFFPRRPAAPRRSPAHSSFVSRVCDRLPEDETCIQELMGLFADVGRRVQAANVYVPLAVGGEVDRVLIHEAAVESFQSGAGRNVFLVEERPQALVKGAVRIRLSQVGARLPPGVAETLSRGMPLRYAIQSQRAGDTGPRGIVERIRWARRSPGIWRTASAWRPEKALGLRLQPLLQDASPSTGGPSRAFSSAREARQLVRWGARYAKELGRPGRVERYWLLLPSREAAGTTRVSPVADEAVSE